MEPALKQRLVGAAVLVALAVIFLPMLVQGPAPDSGAADVPLSMPDAPADEFQTRELPLVTPAGAPVGGVLSGSEAAPMEQAAEAAIIEEAPATASIPAEPAAAPSPDAAELEEPATRPAPSKGQDANGGMFPAGTAGGDYAVSFGSYSTVAAADAVVKALRASQLPGFRESALVAGKTWHRVRIGPYATRAEAEAARLRAAHVRDDVGARVVVLDATAETQAPPKKTTASQPAPAPAPVAKPAAADTGFAVQLAAFSDPADAAALRDRARAAGFSAFTEAVATDAGTLTRVRVGPVATREQAERLRGQVRAKLGTDGVVRPHP